jgi:hypothetical protein
VKAPDPVTRQPDFAKLKAFLSGHPNAARVFQLLQGQPALVSFAQVSYRPLCAYYPGVGSTAPIAPSSHAEKEPCWQFQTTPQSRKEFEHVTGLCQVQP